MPYPTSFDWVPNPVAGDSLSATNVLHHTQHASANNLLSALQVKVGVNNSTDPTSLDYRVAGLSGSASAQASAIHALSGSASAQGSAIGYLTATATVNPGHRHNAASLDSIAVTALLTGGYKIAYHLASGNITATYAMDLIRCSGALTAVLPGASGLGKLFHFKNITGTTLISASGADRIDGTATILMSATYQSLTLVDTSGNWDILG